MDNLSGQHIKGYELRERIGTGGFGAVYKAQQSTVNREVAIKIILPHFSNHPDFIRRFENEAQLVARLEHLHIVPLYDYWRDPDGAYLVMRWLRGGSLRDSLQKGPFTPELAISIVDQLSSALATAHRSNIIHRDLKPGNILLDEDGNAYLADFGIAKDISLKGSMTEPDAIIGSPDYLAPEQARGEIVTPATDIYSLGVVLYEILTGQHPFPNITSVERLYKHLNEPLPLIPNLPDDIRGAINNVIQKATAKNPLDRYSDVLDMASAFRSAAHSQNTGSIVEVLTLREQEILRLIVNGRSNKEIAEELFIAVNTVKWYATQIYQKLGVRTRVQAIVRARELNLIRPNSSGVDIILDTKTVIPTDEFQPPNPYKGLRSFQAADNQDFFGREKLIDKLIKRMSEVTLQRITSTPSTESEMGRFLAIVGPSGSGKSSLVKGGLVPALWRGDLLGSEKWFIVDMLPGSHPLDELEVSLTRVAANQSGNLREQLERDERGLVRASQLILPNDGTELVLIIDQFEEVFTLVANEQERIQFLKLIQSAVSDPRSRIRIVVTLRADFYDRPLHYAGIGELFRSRIETILPLTAEGLERAISQPAERVGVRFEPGLVAKIISEVNYQPGALPLLQYALTELFELRQGRLLTLEAYQSIGATVGALAKRVDELYLSMSTTGQEASKQMFMRLVTLGEGVEDTRRRVARSELLAITTDSDIMDEVIDTFAEYRLLSLDNDPNTRTPTVEVAHEAILREWERLRGWLNESRDDIKLQRQLASTAYEWEHAGKEPSFLLRGSRLTSLAKWSSETSLALTEKEHHYLQESLNEQHRQLATEIERQARVKALEQRSIRFLRILVAVLLVAVLGAFGLSGYAVSNANEAQAARATSENDAKIAEANFIRAERVRLAAQAENAINNGRTGNIVALLALQSLKYGYSAEADAALLRSYDQGFVIRTFKGDDGWLTDISYAPNGKTFVTSSINRTASIWDVATGKEILKLVGHETRVNCATYSSDGDLIVTGANDGTIRIWDAKLAKETMQFRIMATDQIYDCLFSPDNQSILVTGSDGKAHLLKLDNGHERLLFTDSAGSVDAIAFSPDGHHIFTAGDDKLAYMWDASSGQKIRTFTGHSDWIEVLKISLDGKQLLTGSGDKTAILWDIDSGNAIFNLTGHSDTVSAIDFFPDGLHLMTSSFDDVISIWETTTGTLARRITGNDVELRAAAVSPDGNSIIATNFLISVLWDARLDSEPAKLIDPNSPAGPWSVQYSNDNKYIMTSGPFTATFWDAQTLEKVRSLNNPVGIRGAVLLPDGKTIFASADTKPIAYLLDAITGKTIRDFPGHTEDLNFVQVSTDANYGVSTSFDKTVRLWDLASGAELRILGDHTQATNAAIFASDNKTMISTAMDGTARLWDVKSGKALHTFDSPQGVVQAAFSPDGNMILTGGIDSIARIWDARTYELLHVMTGHTDLIWGVGFSPDGKYALTGGDHTIRLWDVQTGTLLRVFDGRKDKVMGVTFSPDGSHILSGTDHTGARLWLTNIDDAANWICDRLSSDFTKQERLTYNITSNQPSCPKFTREEVPANNASD